MQRLINSTSSSHTNIWTRKCFFLDHRFSTVKTHPGKQLYPHEMKRMLTIIMRILTADPEFGSPLTEQQIREFLLNSKLNIHIGTVLQD
jgi:hypothetical protein